MYNDDCGVQLCVVRINYIYIVKLLSGIYAYIEARDAVAGEPDYCFVF